MSQTEYQQFLEYIKPYENIVQQFKNGYLCVSIHPIQESELVTPNRLLLEADLLKTKKSIDEFHLFDKEKVSYYEKASRIMDPFSFYKSTVKQNVSPVNSMTNAWLKCWEMIHVFELLPQSGHSLVFCNAELPGAFLFAIHHFMNTKSRGTYDWMANSLYPSDGAILGDQFGLYSRYPKKWCMTSDGVHNGDVTSMDTIERLKQMTRQQVDLYTSDIGIEMTHETFDKQEEIEAPLHLGQIICGLQTLKEGGHLVCKTFMFFSPFSMSLLYLTSLCFKEFFIYKPETSRPGNSEVYWIGKAYLRNEEIIELFMNTLSTWKKEYMDIYLKPIPEEAYLKIVLASYRIFGRQIGFIEEMVGTVKSLYHKKIPCNFKPISYTQLFKKEQQRLQHWISRFSIPYLHPSYSLFNSDWVTVNDWLDISKTEEQL